MIKKTLYFGNPAYLSIRNAQLLIKLPEVEKCESFPDAYKVKCEVTKPVEDIGIIVLDNKQITITSGALDSLLANGCAVITCDSSSMPSGLLMPLSGNTIQSERFTDQLNVSQPLKKQLWQQTVKSKIKNQSAALRSCTNAETGCMDVWAGDVKSDDSDNKEARAASYYWKNFFPYVENFTRNREGNPPNNLLNYGYAILRAVVARNLVISGLLPTLGIHHHNRYNAYCLADDIMEPYRPYVDVLVADIIERYTDYEKLTTEIKRELLQIPTIDVTINENRSPLMIAVSITTASLAKCFSGELRRISYPEL